MDQVVFDLVDGSVREMYLPSSAEQVCLGIRWGEAAGLFTPAFWKARFWCLKNRDQNSMSDYRTGDSLVEEVVFCLLGGHGIKSEMAQSAYEALSKVGLFAPNRRASVDEIRHILDTPMPVGGQKKKSRYRFPNVKAKFVAAAIFKLERERPPEDDREFRNWLREFPGIGWKTASWITRNWLNSSNVAVVDIHVFRAGVIMGLFEGSESTISANYRILEEKFLTFASAINEDPRTLDVLIWRTMKDSESVGLDLYDSVRRQISSVAA